MKKIRVVIVVFAIVAFGVVAITAYQPKSGGSKCGVYRSDTTVIINATKIVTEVAQNSADRDKGLSGRSCIEPNHGMLFIFDKPGQYPFWMKDMKFPIDIIWIDSDKTIIHIENNLQPCSSEVLRPTYKPNDASMYVLETVGGFAEKYDILKGTRVGFELKALPQQN